jgi:hypothetical protein
VSSAPGPRQPCRLPLRHINSRLPLRAAHLLHRLRRRLPLRSAPLQLAHTRVGGAAIATITANNAVGFVRRLREPCRAQLHLVVVVTGSHTLGAAAAAIGLTIAAACAIHTRVSTAPQGSGKVG